MCRIGASFTSKSYFWGNPPQFFRGQKLESLQWGLWVFSPSPNSDMHKGRSGKLLRICDVGATLMGRSYCGQNPPHPMASNCFCTPTPSWRNRVHKLWHSKAWRTNRQTNKQKNSTFWPPGGGWNPSPTKLGMVIEDFKHVPAPLKLLGSVA